MYLTVEQVEKKMRDVGFRLTDSRKIDYGWQLRFGKRIVNVYQTGRVAVQGENTWRTKQILGLVQGSPPNKRKKQLKRRFAPIAFNKEAHEREVAERLAVNEGTPPWDDETAPRGE